MQYNEREVHLLGERGTTRLFHCTCRGCGHAMLAMILETQGSVSSVGLVTDLEVQDALRFRDRVSLTSDECLLAHRVLEDHSRDVCQILQGT